MSRYIKQIGKVDIEIGNKHIKEILCNCPFCGGQSNFHFENGDRVHYSTFIMIGCFDCGIVYEKTIGMDTEDHWVAYDIEDAISTWNQRK